MGKKMVGFQADETVHAQFKVACAQEGVSMGEMLEALMRLVVKKVLGDTPEVREETPQEKLKRLGWG